MGHNLTNADKILQAVLKDPGLVNLGDYRPQEYETISDALNSDNAYVYTVAKIIDEGSMGNKSEKQLYNEIANYLFKNI